MIDFFKKLFGIGGDIWPPVEEATPAPVIEQEKVIVIEKKKPKAALPKKPAAKREPKKREKPALKAVKVEATPTKKRGRPSKKK